MAQSNYPLRLQTSLLAALRRLAKEEGASVNQLINVAVAEKLSAMLYDRPGALRAGIGDSAEALRRLAKIGRDETREGDEVVMSARGDAEQVRLARSRSQARAQAAGLADVPTPYRSRRKAKDR